MELSYFCILRKKYLAKQWVHVSQTKFEVCSISPEGYLTCFLYIGYINLDSWNGWCNDQNDGIEWPLSTFVSDTKLGGVADTLEGRAATQTDLVRLEQWALEDFMKFSKGKAKPCNRVGITPQVGQAGNWLDREQLCKKGAEGCGGQAEYESAVCSWSSCAQLQTGLSLETHQWVWRELILPLHLTLVTPHVELCVSF